MPGRDLSAELYGTKPAPASTGGGRDLTSELYGPSWGEVPGKAVQNLIPSAGNFLSGIGQAVMHPLDTAGNVLDIGAGALHNMLPASVSSAIDKLDPGANAAANQQRMVAKADATGQFFKDRYGSGQGLRTTLATDPVGAASDLSALLSGGATLAGKIPALAGTAAKVGTVADMVNPVGIAARAVPAIGNGTASLVGGLGTHTGGESLKTAFQSGRQGGQAAQSLADNMRGNVPMTDVLDTAKANLAAMGRAKSQAYRQGMAQVSNDKSVLDFDALDKAINQNAKVGNFNGQVTNTPAAAAFQSIRDAVDNWKNLDPAVYHTPEGFDALKQQIGGIMEGIPYEQKTARLVAGNIYNAAKDTIVKQAPVYADVMKQYSDASDQINEIQRTLSLGPKASADTAMRKLQSLMRNNVNTNYGNRLNLAQELEQQGGQSIMPALAGQALSSATPRGLGGAVAAGLGMGGYQFGGLPGAVGMMAMQSPRLMGEAALAGGKGAGVIQRGATPLLDLLDRNGIDPLVSGNLLYQSGRLPGQ